MTSTQYVDGTDIDVVASADGIDTDIFLSYESYLLDSTNFYCEKIAIQEGIQGSISDGSGVDPYVSDVDCKWLINTTEGKRIILTFEDFDTQHAYDFVYIFEGDKPLQKSMIAGYSGSELPPTVISKSNQLLVWFVSDGEIQRDGWKINYATLE